jgi:hypothetical protein
MGNGRWAMGNGQTGNDARGDQTMTDTRNVGSTIDRTASKPDSGEKHLGAVEGDRPTDQPNQGNPNAPAIDENGLPNDPIAVCEDAIGANVDESEGG